MREREEENDASTKYSLACDGTTTPVVINAALDQTSPQSVPVCKSLSVCESTCLFGCFSSPSQPHGVDLFPCLL